MNVRGYLVSLGVGGIDATLDLPEVQFTNKEAVQDVIRGIFAVGGSVADYMGYYSEWTEPLAISSIPLFVKTVVKYVKGAMAKPSKKYVGSLKPAHTQAPRPTTTASVSSF